MRKPRQLILSDYLHVTTRGLGRRILFEDDRDRRWFLATLRAKLESTRLSVLVWCLMDNHVHLLVHDPGNEVTSVMGRLCTSYAQYFNGRHGHVGKVFQKRFSSQPITSDEHLFATIRYIHANAEDAGCRRPEDYPWSSYRESAGVKGPLEGAGLCDRARVLSLVGGEEGFARLHAGAEHVDFARLDGYRPRIDDAEALEIATARYGDGFADAIAAKPREERDSALRALKNCGLSIRQIERLTGIGRSIIARA